MELDGNTVVDLQEVVIVGNKRTKTSYFANELRESVLTRGAPTVRGCLQSLNEFTSNLMDANLFDHVDSNLQVESVGDGRCRARVVVSVREKGVPFVNAQSYVRSGDQSEAGVEVQAALRSPLGLGETVRVASLTSSAGCRELTAKLSVPHLLGGGWELTARAGRDQAVSWQSYQAAPKALLLAYRPRTSSGVQHQLIAEHSLRDEVPNPAHPAAGGLLDALLPAAASASSGVLAAATASLKTSLKHTLTATPVPGAFVQTALELAPALGREGAAHFVKAELTARAERALGPALFGQPGLSLSLGAVLGVMRPLGGGLLLGCAGRRPAGSYLSDRFQLGGPLSLRGFAQGGAGPRGEHQDSLGGDAKAAAVALCSVPLPLSSQQVPLRAFVFVNAGALGTGTGLLPAWGQLRASAGAGLSLQMAGAVRLEATYALPLRRAPHDSTAPFQLGIGLAIN